MIQGIRRTDGSTQTPGGHPLPLTGKPLTETPVMVKKEGVSLKQYPEVCITIDPFFENVRKTYDGPVALAQNLMCINVTPEQIVLREAQTSLLHWTPPGPEEEGSPHIDPKSPGTTEQFVVDTILPAEG